MLKNEIQIQIVARLAPVIIAAFGFAACADNNDILAKEEAVSLQKSVAIFKDLQGRTAKALEENKYGANFKKVRWLLQQEATGDLVGVPTELTNGWTFVIEKSGVLKAEKSGAKVADVVALLKALVKSGQRGFIKTVSVDDKTASVEVNRWLAGFPERKSYLRGDLPSFEEIKLGHDSQRHRINPKHVVQPANEAIRKEADKAYLKLKAEQEKLIRLGHSQVVGNMMGVVQRLQGSPAALQNASLLFELVAADSTFLKVVANDRGLLVDRSLSDDKGAALQKSVSDQGYFLDQMQVAETLRFLMVRKEYLPLKLDEVKAPATLEFKK